MKNKLQQNFRKKLTKQERNRIYYKPKPITLWDMLDEKSKENLERVKSNAKN
jgi:hypothetical protein